MNRIRAVRSLFTALIFTLVFSLALLIFPHSGMSAFAEESDPGKPGIGSYMTIRYNNDNGLLSSEANVLLSDSRGYLWIGSYAGLTRYDSNDFITYGNSSTIMKNVNVRTLFEDSRGRIWIGSNEFGVFRWESGEFTRIEYSEDCGTSSVRAFAELPDGRIVVSTTGGVMLFSDDLPPEPMLLDGKRMHSAEALIRDRSDCLWAIAGGEVVCISDRDTVFTVPEGKYTSSAYNCLYETSDGRIIIGTSGSEIIELTPITDGYQAETVSCAGCATVNCILEDSYGRLWICSDNGIGFFDDDVFTLAESIDFSAAENMVEDYEGNLWLASSRFGVLELVRGKTASLNNESGLGGIAVNCVTGYEDSIFVSTDKGLYVLDKSTHTPKEHVLSDLLEGVRVRGTTVASDGSLWVCTYNASFGVIRYINGRYDSINTESGLVSNKVRSVLERSNGDMFVATSGGVSLVRKGRVIANYDESTGLENAEILSMCLRPDGSLLLGTNGKGIYVLSGGRINGSYKTSDGLGSDVILNIKYDDLLGGCWISTGSTLNFLEGNTIRTVDLPGSSIGSIFDFVFSGEDIFIVKATSMLTVDRAELLRLGSAASCEIYDRRDGLQDITSNSRQYLSPDGLLYLSTNNGVLTFDSERIYRNETVPRAIINSVTVDGTVYDNPTELTIPSDANTVTFNFTALNYTTDDVRIIYQLVGSDPIAINDSGSRMTRRDYTNLKGGEYTFTITVRNAAGAESLPVSVVIHKEAAFHERPVGIAAVCGVGLVLLSLLTMLIVRLRTRALSARESYYRRLTELSLETTARTIDAKDSYTNGHSKRVAIYSREIARRLGWSKEQQEDIYSMGLMHDVGKVGIPDSLLTKSSRLSDEEYEIMKQHSEIGYRILKDFDALPGIELAVRYHHEKYDGTGYNFGLSGEEIPIHARVIAVADAYDAMSTKRVYRPAKSQDEVKEEIKRCAGKQLDPELARIMLDMISSGFAPVSIEFDSIFDPELRDHGDDDQDAYPSDDADPEEE